MSNELANIEYKVTTDSKSKLEISARDVPIVYNQMIVWILTSENADKLLPEYWRIRKECKE